MSISLKITNTRCPAACQYCYEHYLREHGADAGDRPLDLDAVMKQLNKEWAEREGCSSPPYLHGGEALSAGYELVETFLKKSYELAGSTNIQTNGYLIDDRYIEMFKKYKTSVGVSIDGPHPLNRARVIPGVKAKDVADTVMKNIYKLRANGIHVSIICVLHKWNSLPEPREILKKWILELKQIGICSGRLNLMHSDYIQYGKSLELSEEEAEDVHRDLARFILSENDGLYWQPFHDAVGILTGVDSGTCVFGTRCAYYHAHAEPVILSDGSTANCLKTAKTGCMYPRMEQWDGDFRAFGGVRYEVLPQVSQEDKGCKGCKYWLECGGGCPSEGLEGDWRNRTRFCKAYFGLFDEVEHLLKRLMPNIRLTPDHRKKENEYMNPPAFALMDRNYTQNPSTWRTTKLRTKEAIQVKPPQGTNHLDHADRGNH